MDIINMQKRLFCTNLVRLRKHHQLTKKAMAKILNISLYSLNRLEAGIIPPRVTVGILYAIWNHFKRLPSEMLEGELSFPDNGSEEGLPGVGEGAAEHLFQQ